MNSLGLVELSSVASGMQAADMMLKTSEVELVLSRTICSGKYMVMVGGDVAVVHLGVVAVVKHFVFSIIVKFVIPYVHPVIFPAV